MGKTNQIYISNSFDPAVNLSYEEYLMSVCKKEEVIFYLWQNKNTVVIGRNQNPVKECNIELLKEDNVKLVRRLSGGGAVYHDLGNLNFTFIAHSSTYNIKKQLEVILDALKSFGIVGNYTGRNDLTVDGKKFSGNAFMEEDEVCCHHGTLLVNVALEKLVNYLTPAKVKVTSKGIESIRSRVTNLKELNEEVTIGSLKKKLIESFNRLYNDELSLEVQVLDDFKLIKDYARKYNTWEWNMKESPKCNINTTQKFDWGTFDIDLDIDDGLISSCFINTDSIIMENFELLEERFIGSKAKIKVLHQSIDSTIENEMIREDIKFSLLSIFNL
ncbi:lipoate--protein ligase [Mycoplasmatota bacterium]|nr:lipoate--protein ligase [Mycoplasmatota bacterium]